MQLLTPARDTNKYIFWTLIVIVSVLTAIAVYVAFYLPEKTEKQLAFDPFSKSDFVYIYAGTFNMGSNAAVAYPDEQPVHQVTITKPFWIGKTEVTQAQWLAIMNHNPSLFPRRDHPVDNVDWGDIQTFINRLNKIANCGNCYRLPTEAEWEYAARAGSNLAYGFDNAPDSLGLYAWYAENSDYTTHPVASKRPNAWGLYDMQGNVYEWVQDFYGPYAAAPSVDPRGATVGTEYVLRGGSWTDEAREQRPTYRDYYAPTHRHDFFGFRLVREAEFEDAD